jgi:hypothetical protein
MHGGQYSYGISNEIHRPWKKKTGMAKGSVCNKYLRLICEGEEKELKKEGKEEEKKEKAA